MSNLKATETVTAERWECHCPANTGGLFKLCPFCEVEYAKWVVEVAQAQLAEAEAALAVPRV